MSNENKTHYRKVFKSDHLGVADLEDFLEAGSKLVFTIAYVRQEMKTLVAGKKIDANIAYFEEGIKPLVLNATNSKTMRVLTDSCFIDDWENITVQLYIDRDAKLKGEVVGGVRILKKQVTKQKLLITEDNKKLWNGAIFAYKRDKNFDRVLEKADISEKDQKAIKDLCNV